MIRLFSLILMALLSINQAYAAQSRSHSEPTPKQFLIAFYSSGQGIYRHDPIDVNVIKSSGDVITFKSTTSEMKSISLKTKFSGKRTHIGKNTATRIYQKIQNERFFSLDHEYKSSNVKDGDAATISVITDSQEYTVTTINIRVDAFDRIVKAINKELPKPTRLHYNALDFSHIQGLFERVER